MVQIPFAVKDVVIQSCNLELSSKGSCQLNNIENKVGKSKNQTESNFIACNISNQSNYNKQMRHTITFMYFC